MDNLPQGILDIATGTSNVGATSGTTPLDIITASAVTPATASRVLKVTFTCRGQSGSNSGDQFVYKIKEGATVLAEYAYIFATGSLTNHGITFFAIVDAPTAASHTYKATIERTSGSGTGTVSGSSDGPIRLIVEDIGLTGV